MRPQDRIITHIPLRELFDENGPVVAERQSELSVEDIRELLRSQVVQFVVADVGARPVWVPETERFRFWKSELLPHVAVPGVDIDLEDFPGGYCYYASAWDMPGGKSVVLLERYH